MATDGGSALALISFFSFMHKFETAHLQLPPLGNVVIVGGEN
jgi:hypothetical protein